MSASVGAGGGGTPLKILFQILGINEAKAAISSLSPEVSKLSSAADAASKKVSGVARPLEQAGAAGQKLTPASQNMQKVGTTSENAARSVTKVSGSMDKTRSSSDNVTSSVQRFDTESSKARNTTENLSGSLEKTSTSSRKSSQELTGVASSSGRVTSESSKTAKSVDSLGGSHEKLGKTTKDVSSGLKQEETDLRKVDSANMVTAGSADKNATSHGNLKSAFTATMGSAAALGGGVVSLWQSYDSLGDAQLRVDKATNALHTTQLKAESLQAKLNKLTEEGKTGTDEYRLTAEKLEVAQAKVTAAEGTLQNAQEDLNITNAEFYQNIIPEAMTVLGSLTALMANGGGVLKTFTAGISNLSIETIKTSNVMKLISLSNPFFIALTVGAGIVTAFVTNLFGFRDALNGIGVAIGNAIGPLKPFLTMIGDLGQGLVNALGMGGDATKKYADTTGVSMDEASGAVGGHQKEVTSQFELQHKALMRAGLVAAGFTTDFVKNMDTAGGAMPGLSGSVGTAVETSVQKMDRLIAKSKETAAAMGEAFTKNVDLGGGAQLTGLSDKAPPTSTVSKDIGGRFDAGKDLGTIQWQKLTDVITQFDPIAQKTSFSLVSLQAAAKKAGIEGAAFDKVLNYLTKTLGYQAVEGTKAAASSSALSDAQKRIRDTQEATNKVIAEGGKWHALTSKELGIESSAATLAAGTTQALTDALTGTGEGAAAAAGGTQKLIGGQKILNDQTNASQEAFASYNEILNSEAMMHDVAAQGVLRQKAAMAQAKVEVVGNAAASLEYAGQLRTLEGQALAVAEGMVKQQDSLNQAKAAMLGNAGALALLSQSTVMADAKNVAYVDGVFKTELALKNQMIASEGTRGEIQALVAQQERGEAQAVAYTKGLNDQEKQFQLDKIAIYETAGTLIALQNEYARGEAQTLAYNKGLLSQKKAFEESKVEADNIQGTIGALNQELDSGEAYTVAYNNSWWKTEEAFVRSKTSAEELRAVVDNMQKNFDEAKVIAYNNAFQDQRKKLEEDKLAVVGLSATYDVLLASISSLGGQLLNFNKGFNEANVAFVQAEAATFQLDGAIVSLVENMHNGMAATQAMTKGMLDQRKAGLDSIVALDTLSGSIEQYGEELLNQQPQTVAFMKGLLDTRMATLQMAAGTTELAGTVQGLFERLADGNNILVANDKAWYEGGKAAAEWGMSVRTADEEQAGLVTGLQEVGEAMGVVTEGFVGSVDDLKTWIGVMGGVETTINDVASKMYESGQSLMSGLHDAIAEGKPTLDKDIEEIANKMGVILPDEIKGAMVASQVDKVFAEQMNMMLDAGMAVIERADPVAVSSYIDLMRAKWENGLAELSPSVAGKVQGVIDQINQLMSQGPPNGAAGYKVWAVTMEGLMNQVQAASDPTKKALDGIAGIRFSEQPIQAWETLLEKMKNNQPLTDAELKMKAAAESANLIKPGADQAGQGVSDMAVKMTDAAKGGLNQLVSGLTLFGNQYMPAFVKQVNDFALQLFEPIRSGVVGRTLLQFGQVIQAIPTQVGQMVSQSNQILTQLGSNLITTVLPKLQTNAAAAFQGIANIAASQAARIGPPYANAANAIGSALNRTQQVANTAFSNIQRAAQNASSRMAQPFVQASNQIASAAANAASRVVSSMSRIGSSASSAAGQVRSLAGAINALRSKTVTITTVVRRVVQTVYAAKGFGPAIVDSPTPMMVGESGPELVTVQPLDSSSLVSANRQGGSFGGGGGSGRAAVGRSVTNSIRGGDSTSNSVFSQSSAATSNSILNSSLSTTSNNTVINEFNRSVAKITNAFDRQETRMTSANTLSSIQNANTVMTNNRSSSSAIGGAMGITNITNTGGGIPNIGSIRGGGGAGSTPGGGGGSLEAIVGTIKEMVLAAFAQTNITLNNTTTIDTEKVYQAQKKQFGLRNGSMFK